MAKTHIAFRLPAQTQVKIKELAKLFRQSEAVIVENAVDYYHSRRIEILEEDNRQRIEKARES